MLGSLFFVLPEQPEFCIIFLYFIIWFHLPWYLSNSLEIDVAVKFT